MGSHFLFRFHSNNTLISTRNAITLATELVNDFKAIAAEAAVAHHVTQLWWH